MFVCEVTIADPQKTRIGNEKPIINEAGELKTMMPAKMVAVTTTPKTLESAGVINSKKKKEMDHHNHQHQHPLTRMKIVENVNINNDENNEFFGGDYIEPLLEKCKSIFLIFLIISIPK